MALIIARILHLTNVARNCGPEGSVASCQNVHKRDKF